VLSPRKLRGHDGKPDFAATTSAPPQWRVNPQWVISSDLSSLEVYNFASIALGKNSF
jgi:hypothetical protein